MDPKYIHILISEPWDITVRGHAHLPTSMVNPGPEAQPCPT